MRQGVPIFKLYSELLPLPPQEVKFFTYGVILLKFETQHFHMFTNGNFFIYIAILMKFGIEQFYVYNNNNLDYNFEMKFSFPPPAKENFLLLKKVKLFIYGAFC